MKKTVRLTLLTLLCALAGAFLWSLWAARGACAGLEWLLEALILTVTFRVPAWVWALSAGAFWAVRFAAARLKAKKP